MDLEHLNTHIRHLATLSETDSAVISCYVNLERGRASCRDALDARINEIRPALPSERRRDFEQALGRIETFLALDINPAMSGAAFFSRAGGSPFFLPLQFRLPLPNRMLLDSVPRLYELVALKDTYHRYIVLISAETHARIIEVSVGEVTSELWMERQELRTRVGREWTKEHYQNHRQDRTQKFIKEKIEILNRLVMNGGHTHLLLAGSSRTLKRVRASLPRRLRDKLIDVVPVPGESSTADVVAATLSVFAEHEQTESMETASLLLDQLRTGGLAVAGTEATLEALARGQVDILVLSESYTAPTGWRCRSCEAAGANAVPGACPRCGEHSVAEVDLSEEMVRLAERLGSTVEIVRNSGILFDVGGVGCVLRYLLPEQRIVGWRGNEHGHSVAVAGGIAR